jgi:hypothetical protein
MSQHQAFRRQAVPDQVAQKLQTTTLPAPIRGIVQSENYTFMQPGGAMQLDNWKPTLRGLALRGGCILWNDLHALDAPAWGNATAYTAGTKVYDNTDGSFWTVAVNHTSAASPTTFPADRTAHPTYWSNASSTVTRLPVISAFQYVSGAVSRMFAANASKLFEITAFGSPTLVKSGQASGNYCVSQLATQGGDWLLAVNDAGDPPLRFNGSTWATLATTTPAAWIVSTVYAVNARALDATDNSRWKCAIGHTSGTGTFAADRAAHPTFWVADSATDGIGYLVGPPGTTVVNGGNLVYVWKYRNRWFFIEGGSMNAWYLPTNTVGGQLSMIPLSGAASKGGKLLFGAAWSVDAGDGIDDKCVFYTDQGEALIFTGTNPSDAANWRQEGRYFVGVPMGMNAHTTLGGDLLIATVDGIAPISAAITKDSGQLELAMITKNIRQMWRNTALVNNILPWTLQRWDEYGGMFASWPGGAVGNQYCGVVNTATGAWCRYSWDVVCFCRMRGDMFFGTQTGFIMQADRTGYDNGKPYTAIMVGGWEMFQSPSQTVTWFQTRASFVALPTEPFNPLISAAVDYNITLQTPPSPGPDPGVLDVWDQGLWDSAKWDATAANLTTVRHTGWVSVGATGYSHAPIVQVVVAQKASPSVELISLAATYNVEGVNV